MKFTPMKRYGALVYLPNVSGGFEVRNCHEAESLAQFIVTACNAHEQLVEALKNAHPYVGHAGTRIEIGAALKAAGAV
jgi:hypothetical protein